MAVRTKAEIASQISSLLANNTSGNISAADLRSVLTDIIDSVSFPASGMVGTHTRYFGWSADRTISMSDLAGANTSLTNAGTLPAQSQNAYIWFAVPQSVGYPTQLFLDGGSRDNIPHFEQLPGTVNDSGGEAHYIGISYDLQIAALGGRAIEIGYN